MPTNSLPSNPNPFPPVARRQTHFLRQIEPHLTALPGLSALWLGGSAGRGDADRWSSVDLYCLVEARAQSLISERVEALLDSGFPDGWTSFGLQRGIQTAWLDGLTHAHLPRAANQGGVCFRIYWTALDWLIAQETNRRVHLLWSQYGASVALTDRLSSAPQLENRIAETVQTGLIEFWQLLARLPAAINRDEHLAAVNLLQRVRMILTDLVVRLNGVTRPDTPARINRFLGPAQQDAFEKTLRQSSKLGESWIGQAVALIVLYHWYAPQLVEIHKLIYPTALEKTVLALLSTEVSGWPAQITTA